MQELLTEVVDRIYVFCQTKEKEYGWLPTIYIGRTDDINQLKCQQENEREPMYYIQTVLVAAAERIVEYEKQLTLLLKDKFADKVVCKSSQEDYFEVLYIAFSEPFTNDPFGEYDKLASIGGLPVEQK